MAKGEKKADVAMCVVSEWHRAVETERARFNDLIVAARNPYEYGMRSADDILVEMIRAAIAADRKRRKGAKK